MTSGAHSGRRVTPASSHVTLRILYRSSSQAITIGIRGPDAADRINQLRHALAKLITKHGWTTRDQLLTDPAVAAEPTPQAGES